jgi:hypothetical protein
VDNAWDQKQLKVMHDAKRGRVFGHNFNEYQPYAVRHTRQDEHAAR